MFHWRDSLYFGRLPDGAVRIVKFSASPNVMLWHDDLAMKTTEYPRSDGEFHSVAILLDVVIPAGEWEFIVASVSKSGEADGRYNVAE